MSIRRTPKPKVERDKGSMPSREPVLHRRISQVDPAIRRQDSKAVMFQLKHHCQPATSEQIERQLVSMSGGSDIRGGFVFTTAASQFEKAGGCDFAFVYAELDPVETLMRDTRNVAIEVGDASIMPELDERASAVVVQALAVAVDRVNRVAQACERSGHYADADHHFEEAQNLRAHLDAVRDARIERGWSSDGDEAPEA